MCFIYDAEKSILTICQFMINENYYILCFPINDIECFMADNRCTCT